MSNRQFLDRPLLGVLVGALLVFTGAIMATPASAEPLSWFDDFELDDIGDVPEQWELYQQPWGAGSMGVTAGSSPGGMNENMQVLAANWVAQSAGAWGFRTHAIGGFGTLEGNLFSMSWKQKTMGLDGTEFRMSLYNDSGDLSTYLSIKKFNDGLLRLRNFDSVNGHQVLTPLESGHWYQFAQYFNTDAPGSSMLSILDLDAPGATPVVFDGILAVAPTDSASRFQYTSIFGGTNQGAIDVQIDDFVIEEIDELPGIQGDFDDDGDVDGSDFLLWQRDNSVGTLGDWQSNFGFGGAASLVASVSAVPEPASGLLLLICGGFMALIRRR